MCVIVAPIKIKPGDDETTLQGAGSGAHNIWPSDDEWK